MLGNIGQGIMIIEKTLSPLLALPCLILSLSNPKKAKMNPNSISPLFLSHMSLYQEGHALQQAQKIACTWLYM
jgi:hypothetical protein